MNDEVKDYIMIFGRDNADREDLIELNNFHNERLKELPVDIVKKSVDYLKENLPEQFKTDAKEMYKKDPLGWCIQFHFTVGMDIRNALRDGVCLDDALPVEEEYQNWDNFYVKLLEMACDCY